MLESGQMTGYRGEAHQTFHSCYKLPESKIPKWSKEKKLFKIKFIKVLKENIVIKISNIPCSNIFANISSRLGKGK